MIWAAVQRFGTLIISFVSNMILARLLTPDDFGVMGMLLFFVVLAQTFVDSGLGAALIQKQDVKDVDVNTVFYINMAISTFVYVILFATSPLIANFYNEPILDSLLKVESLIVLIQGMTIVQTVQFQKMMDFKKLTISGLTSAIISSILAIAAALYGWGVWSLVVKALVEALVRSLMLWLMSKWRPMWIFSWTSFRELFGYGGFILLSSIMFRVSNNVQSLIMGKIFKTSILGNYTQAYQLRNVASDGISSVLAQVLFPEFSNLQNNDEELRKRIDFSIYIISFLVSPLMIWCSVLAKPIIQIIYGDQWDEAVPYLQILCFGGIFLALQDVNINVVKAKGKSKALFIANALKTIMMIVTIIGAGLMFGIIGFLWTIAFFSLIAYLLFSSMSSYYTKSTNRVQYGNVGKCLMLCIVPTCAVYIFKMNISNLAPILEILVCSLIFWGLYIAIAKVCGCRPLLYVIKNLRIR